MDDNAGLVGGYLKNELNAYNSTDANIQSLPHQLPPSQQQQQQQQQSQSLEILNKAPENYGYYIPEYSYYRNGDENNMDGVTVVPTIATMPTPVQMQATAAIQPIPGTAAAAAAATGGGGGGGGGLNNGSYTTLADNYGARPFGQDSNTFEGGMYVGDGGSANMSNSCGSNNYDSGNFYSNEGYGDFDALDGNYNAQMDESNDCTSSNDVSENEK